VVRVVIAAHQGSSPREAGAAMLVWDTGGQSGTIGGGALEWQAARRARALLAAAPRGGKAAAGPGAGPVLRRRGDAGAEVIDAAALAAIPEGGLMRAGRRGTRRDAAARRRALRAARGQGSPALIWKSGWLAEPVHRPARPLWVWGAGHVGRAHRGHARAAARFALTWVDTADPALPESIPAGVTRRPHPDPAALVPGSAADAEHLILTYSHALDLELCHRLLAHGFAPAG
jgi:xanthine dehydrogenase accessory factor